MSNEMWTALGSVGADEEKTEKELELTWLRFFYETADFGPAHEDVIDIIKQAFVEQGGVIPEDYNDDE